MTERSNASARISGVSDAQLRLRPYSIIMEMKWRMGGGKGDGADVNERLKKRQGDLWKEKKKNDANVSTLTFTPSQISMLALELG